MKLNKNQDGSHILAIIIVVVVIGVIGLVGFKVLNKNKHTVQPGGGSSNTIVASLDSWKNGCSGNSTVDLTNSPMKLADIDYTTPYGLLASAHVTPIDHLYFYPKDMNKRDSAPVYAMADGYIVDYQHNGNQPVTASGVAPDGAIRIVMQHNCDFYTYYDLMTSLNKDIYQKLQSGDKHVKITAGEQIGMVGGQSLDTAVYNLNKNLKGFVKGSDYDSEAWKVHLDNFYEYFKQPLQGQLTALNLRKATPVSGKIDYDIAGKLIGNWFKQGTNFYAGPANVDRHIIDGQAGYYSGHFSITPDAVDTDKYNVSFGDYLGKATQFTIKTATPDPTEVGVSDGMVKYEYTKYTMPFKGMIIGSKAYQTEVTKGTILMQVQSGEKMKMEYFDGKTAGQVTDFTSAAVVFER